MFSDITVLIYGKEVCGYCTLSKKLCEENKINYTYRTLDKDFKIEELYNIKPFKTFPQIFNKGIGIGRYNDIYYHYLNKENIKPISHLGDIVDRRKCINVSTARHLHETVIKPIVEGQIRADLIIGNHDT